ncbi:prolipoprotein diacylglyceryl transferase [Isoalcanivorax pacificus W11-5]|uniref:Phosphatidylglycerol--prolipoprotein diacylglyceryl transferase n=1 Tax=Isoalcanivorax pacificus W11-5 TaxID=391936 RepID=A0A0B4XF45_9GAMM|nr:prolipoprotein diacylglyceryl transferase [Isoalcanivorax pacificus]AJD46649.1 prolipoprotein diacylglyceryl transferase [Isoalcanivorax pacificus W11-5]
MLQYPEIDPVAIAIGPLQVHWYGLMYLFGFVAAWWLGTRRAARPGSGWTAQQVSDLVFYSALGVIVGGRVGYTLFYNFSGFLNDPVSIVKLWQGGMSFHGGALGVLVAFWLFARKTGKRYFEVADFIVPMVPIGLCAGRIGNFINGELWGRTSDVPWAMVFPNDPSQLARHPSQLYQSLMEGLLLFIVLWLYSARPRPAGAVTGLFGVGYGTARIVGEFFRQPDAHLGFIAFDWLTMGMLLSTPMVLIGLGMMVWAYRNNPVPGAVTR